MTRALLVCVTGPDGSGKSTACASVRERLDTHWGAGSALEVSVWDCLATQRSGEREISPAFSTPDEAALYLGDLDGTSRLLFIFHAMSRALQLANRAGARVLLLNGYWYKYAVSELGYGVSAPVVLGAAAGFPRPDRVFCLDIDPRVAWERRLKATRYEQGPGGEGFIRFQEALRAHWREIESRAGLEWEHLSAEGAAGEIAGRIESGILAAWDERAEGREA